jgi:repressor LexA
MNRKLAQTRPEGYFAIRVRHRKGKGNKTPRFLFECGCCDGKFEVYYGDGSLEIAGVMGSLENWRELLLPLLNAGLPEQSPSRPNLPSPKFTVKQGQYLAYIDGYTKVHGVAPAEADLQKFFGVSPPTVHQMILALEKRQLISRVPGQARSIRVVAPPSEIPDLV